MGALTLVGQPCTPYRVCAAEGPAGLAGGLLGGCSTSVLPPLPSPHMGHAHAPAHLRWRRPHRLLLASAHLLPQSWHAQFCAAEWRALQCCLQQRQMTVAWQDKGAKEARLCSGSPMEEHSGSLAAGLVVDAIGGQRCASAYLLIMQTTLLHGLLACLAEGLEQCENPQTANKRVCTA